MLYTATFSADGSAVMTTATAASPSTFNNALGGAGELLDVEIISSADTSVACSIADGTSNVFNIASGDFTTLTKYKNDNAAILTNEVNGQLTATITGLGSGTFIVRARVKKRMRA